MPDNSIEMLRQDWALALMTKGVIARLKMSRWRGYAPLTYDELGLTYCNDDTSEFMKKYIVLGSERLLPPQILSELNTIESQARAALAKYSFETVWGRFIPFSAFEMWEKENKIVKDLFMEAARKMGERYDEIVLTVKENYKKMGAEVWKRIYPHDDGTPSASFLEEFSNRIVSKIPPLEEIVTSFKYDVIFFSIPLPSFLHQDLLKAEIAKNEKALSAVELETKIRITNEYREKKSVLIDEFLDTTVKALRENIAELCQNTLIGLRKSQGMDIHKMQIDKIKRFIDHVKVLNFQNDTEVNTLLDELKNEVCKFKGERDKNAIIKHLQSMVDLSKREFIPDINPIIDCLEP